MQAITLKQFGGPDVLSISTVPDPVPGPLQLLIDVKARGLNRADLLQRQGHYPPPPGETDILGLEVAGTVVGMGSDVSGHRLGDAVFGLVGSGAYAERCLIDYQVAMPVPDGLSFVEAAAIPEAFLTAAEALFTLGKLKPNENVLIHAGASGVGTAAIQMAKHIGATVFTTLGSREKTAKVKALGADTIIYYKEDDFFLKIGALCIDVIIDFIGASYFDRHLRLLRSQGRLICVGSMGGAKAEIDLRKVQSNRLQIKGLVMRSRSIDDKRKITKQFVDHWLPLFITRKIVPVIDKVFDFHEVEAAHRYMESQMHVGKIVLISDK